MKKYVVLLLGLSICLTSFGVQPRYALDDRFWIEEVYDELTERNTYVINRKDESFSGIFYGGIDTTCNNKLKDSKYTPVSSWKLNGKLYCVLVKLKDNEKKRSIITVGVNGTITHIVDVKDLPEPKVIVEEKIVVKEIPNKTVSSKSPFNISLDDFFEIKLLEGQQNEL